MSLKDLQEDFNNIIKPQLGEILRLLKDLQLNNNIEVAAAKIITELKASILECPCNEKFLDAISNDDRKLIIKANDKEKPFDTKKSWKYNFSNFDVGNEGLGSSQNPNSLSWPLGKN